MEQLRSGIVDYNVNLSGGYAGISGEGGAPLLSPAMLLKLGDRAHFVLDSFIYLGEDVRFGIVVPGIRIDRPTKRASFQIGRQVYLLRVRQSLFLSQSWAGSTNSRKIEGSYLNANSQPGKS